MAYSYDRRRTANNRAKILRALRVTIGDMETDLRRRPDQSIGGDYIRNLEAHAKEVEALDPKVARSIRVTMGDMKADLARRGEIDPRSLQMYIQNLQADLARLESVL